MTARSQPCKKKKKAPAATYRVLVVVCTSHVRKCSKNCDNLQRRAPHIYPIRTDSPSTETRDGWGPRGGRRGVCGERAWERCAARARSARGEVCTHGVIGDDCVCTQSVGDLSTPSWTTGSTPSSSIIRIDEPCVHAKVNGAIMCVMDGQSSITVVCIKILCISNGRISVDWMRRCCVSYKHSLSDPPISMDREGVFIRVTRYSIVISTPNAKNTSFG